jgi:hypothetical protein
MRTFVAAGGVAVPLVDGCGRVGVALGLDAACSGMGPFKGEMWMRPSNIAVRRC